MTFLNRNALLASSSFAALLAASPVVAQEVPAPEAPPVEEVAPAPPTTVEPATEEGTITVTGSRIRRNEATSSSPLQIIDPTLGMLQGQQNTAELIQSSPIAAGSSQVTSAISSNFVTNGGPGAQTISLRGLGAERTLVLLNSRRAGPAGTRGAVTAFDLNVLPQSIIKSVEILKDGASSIYGSDAIAGVVNILTKTDTDGLELNGSVTAPFNSGGEQYSLSATWGKDFGRGHILVAADYYKQQELERRDRKFLDCPEDYRFRSDGKTRADLIDPRTGSPRCDGVVWGHNWTYYAYNLPDFPDVVLLQPDYGQNLGQYVPGVPPCAGPGELCAPPGWFPVGYSGSPIANALTNQYHPFERKSSVIPETERKTLYVDGSFELTDSIELYAEFLLNNRKTFNDTFTQIYNFGYAAAAPFAGDPFPGFYNPNPACPLDEDGEPQCFGIVLSPTGLVDDVDNKTDVTYYRAVAGVKGEIGRNWSWDVFGQYSHNLGKYTYTQVLLDSINTQNFKYGSCVGTFTPVSNRPCIDINWVDPAFLAGDLSQEERDFLFDTETGKTKYTQHYLEASATGDLFRLPAGPVGVAVGGVYRRDEIDDQPGHITRAENPDFDPSLSPDDPDFEPEFINNAFANPINSGHTFGHGETKEAFAEINIPIFRNAPFAKSFDLSGAARVTNVKAVRGEDGFTDSNKGNWTYKVMGNWQVNNWVRLRSTYGTSFRAPALFEQFLAAQVSGVRGSNVDPCVGWLNALAQGTITQRVADNCAADQTSVGGPATGIDPNHTGAGIQVSVFNSGGIGELKPETSRALTASIILTPQIGPDTNIALTIDYFDIKVKGEITQLGAANILFGCYNSLDFPNDPICDLFERGQDGNPQNVKNVFDRFININRQHNRGLDFTLRGRQNLGDFGTFSLLANATYQLKDDITLFGGTIDELNGEIGDPKLTGDLNLTLDHKDTTFFWGIDYVGKSSNVKQFLQDNGDLCNLSPGSQAIFGDHCFVVKTASRFYHTASVTQRVADDKFEFTAGVANLFNTKPPRISVASVQSIGQVPAVSQYDWLGRRLFVSFKAKIK